MEITFSRELDGSYLVVTEEERGDTYTEKMLTEAKPDRLLGLQARALGDKYEYRYEISGQKSLEAILSKREMTGEEIRDLFRSIYRISNELEEYLLDAKRLWLEPGLIFSAKNSWQFCLHPAREEDLFAQLQALSRYILKKADHEDEETAQMAYELFRVCHEDNYSFSQIWEALRMEDVSEQTEPEEAEAPVEERAEEPKGLRRFWKKIAK